MAPGIHSMSPNSRTSREMLGVKNIKTGGNHILFSKSRSWTLCWCYIFVLADSIILEMFSSKMTVEGSSKFLPWPHPQIFFGLNPHPTFTLICRHTSCSRLFDFIRALNCSCVVLKKMSAVFYVVRLNFTKLWKLSFCSYFKNISSYFLLYKLSKYEPNVVLALAHKRLTKSPPYKKSSYATDPKSFKDIKSCVIYDFNERKSLF